MTSFAYDEIPHSAADQERRPSIMPVNRPALE
jgi:hypothetical protein